MSFWEAIWFIIVSFAFIAYLMMLFNILIDIFRDPASSGVSKAVWFVALVVFPFITAIVYLVTRGEAMTQRQLASAQSVRDAQDSYIRSVAAASPTEQITQAKALLDSGAITETEFASLKAKALA